MQCSNTPLPVSGAPLYLLIFPLPREAPLPIGTGIFDGTGTTTIQNPTYTYATAGTYNVQLTVTNMQNCNDSVIVPVIVRNNPTAAFSYQNFFCPAGQVNFQDMSIGAGSTIIDRQWFFEPGYTATGPNPIHFYSNRYDVCYHTDRYRQLRLYGHNYRQCFCETWFCVHLQ